MRHKKNHITEAKITVNHENFPSREKRSRRDILQRFFFKLEFLEQFDKEVQ